MDLLLSSHEDEDPASRKLFMDLADFLVGFFEVLAFGWSSLVKVHTDGELS